MTSTTLVGFKPTYVLFDSGTSYCFAASTFIVMHSIPYETLASAWNINTGEGTIISNKECRLYPIIICSREFYANVLVIENSGFDVIMEMDWLSTFHTIIDC